MKTQNIKYTCRVWKSGICLNLKDWSVADYPISFTQRECLEEFCAMVGWEFLGCWGGTLKCRIPADTPVMHVICEYNRLYWSALVEARHES